MKVIAYSIKPFEKGYLARANVKKHEITLISNHLSAETSFYAEGKEAVIVYQCDGLSEKLIKTLAGYGVKIIVLRSQAVSAENISTAARYGIYLCNVSSSLPFNILTEKFTPDLGFILDESIKRLAVQTIAKLDMWQKEKQS